VSLLRGQRLCLTRRPADQEQLETTLEVVVVDAGGDGRTVTIVETGAEEKERIVFATGETFRPEKNEVEKEREILVKESGIETGVRGIHSGGGNLQVVGDLRQEIFANVTRPLAWMPNDQGEDLEMAVHRQQDPLRQTSLLEPGDLAVAEALLADEVEGVGVSGTGAEADPASTMSEIALALEVVLRKDAGLVKEETIVTGVTGTWMILDEIRETTETTVNAN
jgi:hypothetical protein